jgi:hypothetical protein
LLTVVVVVSPDEIQNTPFVDLDSEYRRDGRHVECSVDRPVAVVAAAVVDTSLAAVVAAAVVDTFAAAVVDTSLAAAVAAAVVDTSLVADDAVVDRLDADAGVVDKPVVEEPV